ncbi:hypothetical protein M9H77_32810 [Catharanthus roseus]|uniref:Uncharacterized protein n=1 Tax=Catharanthus roseus TaxID=4058 RepID=A0ACC0A6I3_CATRO|nr:hypothetical protein M9H77_32810 [Catharanthus roseus]
MAFLSQILLVVSISIMLFYGSCLGFFESSARAASPVSDDHHHHEEPAAAQGTNNEVNVDDFGAKGDGINDDTEAFLKAWNKICASSSKAIFHVPVGKEYNLKPITFQGPCNSPITFNLNGDIFASKNLGDYEKNRRYWIIFKNIQDLTLNGGGGTIDGNGQVWWPKHCKRDKTQPCISRATALTFESCKNLVVNNLNLRNSQRMHLTIDDCKNVELSHIKINSPRDSPNTDGIHITGSTNVDLSHCVISTGDDCVSIVGGSHNIMATNMVCGPSHGISIGSLGEDGKIDIVSNIKVRGALIAGADNGVRIKSWQGGKGIAENIVFQDIRMLHVKNPIIIDQFYCDKKGKCPEEDKKAVKIRNVVYKNIKGFSASKDGISLNCSKNVPCEGITMEDVELVYKDGSSEAVCSSAKVSEKGLISPRCSTSSDS